MSTRFHIFLDTTLTYNDPFFKSNFNKLILHAAIDKKEIMFYMSDVVYLETRRHFEQRIKDKLSAHRNINSELDNLTFNNSNKFLNLSEESYLNDFDSYYNFLKESNVLTILESSGSLLNQLIYRSVNRIKPFKEKKSEFRDCVTWLNYSTFAEENNLENCYLISNNITDFYSDDSKSLHKDLLMDTIRIKPYINIQNLFHNETIIKKYLEEIQNDIEIVKEVVEAQDLTGQFPLEYFNTYYFGKIYEICSDYLYNCHPKSINPTFESFAELHLTSITFKKTQDIEKTITSNNALLSGELILLSTFTFQEAEDGEYPIDDLYSESYEVDIILNFSFFINKMGDISDVEFQNVRNIGYAALDPVSYF